MFTGFITAWALPIFGWHDPVGHGGGFGAAGAGDPLDPARRIGRGRTGPTGQHCRSGQRHAPRNSIRLWVATICGFMALYFITSWITKLSIEAGLPQTQAIIASAIYNFGAFAGTVAMSIAGTRYDVRRLCGVLLAATAGVFLFFGGVSAPLWGVLAAAFVMGVTLQGALTCSIHWPRRSIPMRCAPRASAGPLALAGWRVHRPLPGGWALGQHWPLVAIFALFCGPLLTLPSAASVSKDV
jgi:hypothetical protein